MTLLSSFASKPLRAAATALLALGLSAGGAATVSAQTPAVDPSAVIGMVNGQAITEGDIAIAAEGYGIPADQVAQYRAQLIDDVINTRLMAAAAEAEGIDQTEAFLQRLATVRTYELRNSFIEVFIDSQITEADVRALYDSLVAQTVWPEEVKVHHIMVTTEAEALEIIQLLNNGADFATLAQTRSTDTLTAQEGGSLDAMADPGDDGYFTREKVVPEFGDAAFTIPVGTVGQAPVSTDYGWHVIRVDDRRQKPPPSFDSVADQLREQLFQDKFFEVVGGLRDGAEISVPEFDGPADEPAPAVDLVPVDPNAPAAPAP